jgi:hypothetical protein
MILQEGRYYRRRDGLAVGPIHRSASDGNYPFFFQGMSWNKSGKYNVGLDSSIDLIAELTTHEAIPHVPPSDATPKVDRVVLASKILPRLAPDLTPSMAARQALQYADAFLKEIEND